jgi:hypothetical protein
MKTKRDHPILTDESTGRPPKPRPPRWRGGIVALALAIGPATSAAEPLRPAPPMPATASAPSDHGDRVVATDQSEAPAHRATTQAIRRALMDDDSLSIAARNVIVVTTADGTVTVQGSVKNAREKAAVASTAERIAPGAVVDRLEVETP